MNEVINIKNIGEEAARAMIENGRAVYIGRGGRFRGYGVWPDSKWRNQSKIGPGGTRDEVIAKYRAEIVQQPALMAALPELRGKDLLCWCAPDRCHGDVLLELVAAASSEDANV
jgi:hypothetical protein